MHKLGVFLFWFVYNTIVMSIAMAFLSTPQDKWVAGESLAIGFTCLMMAVIIGSQNKNETK